MQKINWKKMLNLSIWLLIIGLLVYSRFINLGWGLPYPMHPDERNMAVAIQSLNLREGFNPHFFAYGQFPIYFGYLISTIFKLSSTLSLRIISASASAAAIPVLLGILELLGVFGRLGKKNFILYSLFFILLTFSPVLIQLAHFGTTESLLILFYSLIIYFSLLLIQDKILNTKYLILASIFSGLALATKISSFPYLIIPLLLVFRKSFWKAMIFLFFTLLFFIVFSPHNIISFNEFISSLRYESDVATGKALVFYTRQFRDTMPIVFQLTKIFPYALGWPVFVLGVLGLLGGLGLLGKLGREKEINLLRAAFLIVFLPNALMFAKWTRFMAPTFPILIIFATLFLSKISTHRFIFYVICLISILPGLAYLSVYRNPDVRFQASEWIYKHIPNRAPILSETANVIDLPLEVSSYKVRKVYKVISFNFYDLDQDSILQKQLKYYLQNADYIIVPSRRIFKNHSRKDYPLLNAYYQKLFSGELGFKEIAKFESFPKICFMDTISCLTFDDEDAEETWTVFDHPVIRIYKRI